MLTKWQTDGWVKSVTVYSLKNPSVFRYDSAKQKMVVATPRIRYDTTTLMMHCIPNVKGIITGVTDDVKKEIEDIMELSISTLLSIMMPPLGLGFGSLPNHGEITLRVREERMHFDMRCYAVNVEHSIQMDSKLYMLTYRDRLFYYTNDDTPKSGHSKEVKEAYSTLKGLYVLKGNS